VVFFLLYSIDDHVDIVVDFIWCGNGVFHLLLLDSYSVGFQKPCYHILCYPAAFPIHNLDSYWCLDLGFL
jgi:hypothetical protein